MALTYATLIDLNANELILDLDADTSITADSDDTIDFKIGGSDEIKMTTAALSPATADGNALGTAALEWSDLYLADGALIYFGDDQDTTLTHADGSGLTLNSTNKLMFNDATQFIQGSSATVLSIGATDEIDLTATAIDINGTCDISGTFSLAGTNVTATATEINLIDGGTARGTDALASGDGILINDGGTMKMTNVDTVQTFMQSGISTPITALNSATANELVTVGATTTELDAETNLTFDGTDLTLGTGDIVFGTAGKGICLGVTSNTDANTLDDYEEGTFTLTATGSTGSAGTYASSSEGRYTKIGNTVFFGVQVNVTNRGSWSGYLSFTGLPFTSQSGAHHPISVGMYKFDKQNHGAYVGQGDTYIQVSDESHYGAESIIWADLAGSATDYWNFNGSYVAS